ncbi:MAG TPA: polyprenyl diphosphate synthase [Thermomicrobiales bacterium]|nr:polyprenyl diphosphate synthase [Thermomicrobiales bacterium]
MADESPRIENRSVPHHVAIIMDGNGRWAQKRGLPRIKGHEAGTENIRRITTRAGELGISYLTLWAFSTENWSRPADEVEGILRILAETIPREREELHRRGARIRHIGSLEGLDPSLVEQIQDTIELTASNTGINLTLAFNYSGRAEILEATRRIIASGIRPEELTAERYEEFLFTAGMPDPDLIIRTSGEKRISNFFLWQAAFSEWVFPPVLWPDFSEHDLEAAVHEYQSRERRYGGLVTSPSSSHGS